VSCPVSVVVTEDLQVLYDRLSEADSDPRRTFWVEASRDPTKIEYVWGFGLET
jgi:hypothetical protein